MNAGRKNQWSKPMTGLVNDLNKRVDAYLPRKCDWTNRLIFSNDASSVQISVAEVPIVCLKLFIKNIKILGENQQEYQAHRLV